MASPLDNNKEIAAIELPVGTPTAEDWAIFTSADGRTRRATFLQFQNALTITIERIYVESYAEALTYFTGPSPRKVFVEHDEAYGELVNGEYESTFYEYDPYLGTALFGIDFNYTEE